MPASIVFLHAHPDDEALLTAGTMARAAAEGCRVTLITATDGEAGLADSALQHGLGGVRSAELITSARMLGVSRLEMLHYPDSGLHGQRSDGFCHADADLIADRVATIMAQEQAQILVTYDARGGYGHPDHVQVHAVGVRVAARRAGIAVFAATAPREPFKWGVRAAGTVMRFPPEFDRTQFEEAFTPWAAITHKVDVRDYCDFKRAAMHAHASQTTGGNVRTLAALLRLPRPLFRFLLGTEYYARLT